MTRTHAAIQLLRLGPLSFREFCEITGWDSVDCSKTLNHLAHTGRVVYQQLDRHGLWLAVQ